MISRVRLFIAYSFITSISIWVLLAASRTFYNYFKFFVSERELLFATEQFRQENTYGERYDFCRLVSESVNEKSTIYFLTNDAHTFYFCRYVVYPQKMLIVAHESELPKVYKEDEYVLVLETSSLIFDGRIDGLKIQKTYKTGLLKGKLYKK